MFMCLFTVQDPTSGLKQLLKALLDGGRINSQNKAHIQTQARTYV
jgi:hypothetical protein